MVGDAVTNKNRRGVKTSPGQSEPSNDGSPFNSGQDIVQPEQPLIGFYMPAVLFLHLLAELIPIDPFFSASAAIAASMPSSMPFRPHM
jgi:hypothetical protein